MTLVEWAERVPGLLPEGCVWVRIEGAGDGARVVEIYYARTTHSAPEKTYDKVRSPSSISSGSVPLCSLSCHE